MFLALWLHNVGSKIIAFPFRVIIGLVFMSLGYQNLNPVTQAASTGGAEVPSGQALIDLSAVGIDAGFGASAIGVLLMILGACVLVGLVVRIIGGAMCAVVVMNILAMMPEFDFIKMFTQEGRDAMMLFQNRLMLAGSSAVLFFLGSGYFSLDGVLFSALSGRADDDDDDDDKESPRHRRGN
jgi:uncharacterized membrane protein YphA (DoxX/SURF4 family)